MADFFGNEETVAVDPAAEFLAQQEDEIAVLENDALGDVNPPAATNGYGDELFGDGSVADPVVASGANDDMFGLQQSASGDEPLTNGGDNYGGVVESMDPSQAYAAIAAADARIEQLRAEPEKIRIWREEHTKRLAEKDRESEEKQQEWLAQARKELEDWDKNRIDQLEKARESNRAAEAQFIRERDQTTPGTEWERVSKLCEFNPKMTKGSKDVSRMRSSLLHLKQNPRPVRMQLAADN